MERHIFIVSGIPGAGKTTVSGLLARRFDRGVHLEADIFQRLIVTGGLWLRRRGQSPDEEPPEEAWDQLRLRSKHVALLADSFLENGFWPVIDDVVVGLRLLDVLEDIKNRPLYFVLLLPTLDVVEHRDRTRDEKHVFDIWGHLDEVARNETPKQGLWLDSSDMSAEETVDEILSRTDEAVIE